MSTGFLQLLQCCARAYSNTHNCLGIPQALKMRNEAPKAAVIVYADGTAEIEGDPALLVRAILTQHGAGTLADAIEYARTGQRKAPRTGLEPNPRIDACMWAERGMPCEAPKSGTGRTPNYCTDHSAVAAQYLNQ